MGKVFLLGVGAQKSGTTWLHSYLNSHPETDMGFGKEYHIYDALHICERGIRTKFVQGRFERVVRSGLKLKEADRQIMGFLADTRRYFEYFSERLESSGVRLTGDITPSYSGLPVEAFVELREGFRALGVTVKVIFLMREPVSRCVSAVQHILQRPGVSYTGDVHDGKNGEDLVRELFASRAFTLRGRYDKTAEALEQVFEPENIGYFFYEELFSAEAVESICKFLGLSWHAPQLHERINASDNKLFIDEELKQLIRVEYRPVYDFVVNKFGAGRMLATWGC